MTLVRLVGGPLHGQSKVVERTRLVVTYEVERHLVERDWDGLVRTVAALEIVSYKRLDADTFRFCRTQIALGDGDPAFPEKTQLTLDDEEGSHG